MQILRPYLGSAISGTVAYLTDQFAILHFDVEVEPGVTERVAGMLPGKGADLAGVVVSTLHLLKCIIQADARRICTRGSGGLHDGQICNPAL